MGAGISWLSNLLWAKKEIRILILGLVRQPLTFSSDCSRQGTDLVGSIRTMPARRHCCIGSRYGLLGESLAFETPPSTLPLFFGEVACILTNREDITDRRGGDDNTNHRIQCRVSLVSESKLQRLGR